MILNLRNSAAGLWRRWYGWIAAAAWVVLVPASPGVRVSAETVTLNDGLQLTGKLRTANSVGVDLSKPVQPGAPLGRLVVIDNGLRRVFVARRRIRAGGLAPDALINTEEIVLPKRVSSSTRTVGALGTILRTSPFDEFGNRVCTVYASDRTIDVLQGITKITPEYVQVETLTGKAGFYWDMRLATSSFPRAQLTSWMMRGIDAKSFHDRQRIIALYIQAGRNQDALVELQKMLKDFPNARDLSTTRRRLYQSVAQEVLDEIERRQSAGQFAFAHRLLEHFPREGVAGEILLRVEDLLKEYDAFFARKERLLRSLEADRGKLQPIEEAAVLDLALSEIRERVNINNIDRLADYLRLADDERLSVDQKLSLAVTGWLLGSGASRRNLAEALSLLKVRDEVAHYLRTTRDEVADREAILSRLEKEEGSAPELLAPLIAHLLPPLPTEVPEESKIPGMLSIEVDRGEDRPALRYLVQLPPEYDPYRRYPCVVTLHPAGGSPEGQLNWWAGPYVASRRTRMGQATRHGYIVVAPAWNVTGSPNYDYSFAAHDAVLASLRDALRRFSIDTNRVFLSGHSAGGDAAWDIGAAHPDLWAGVIPFVAWGHKYVSYYHDNVRGIPFYFVGGELDNHWIPSQVARLDRYVKYTDYQGIVVEYRGRGHESFPEEAIPLFEWLNRQRRGDPPVEIQARSMRPWDNFFWWIEVSGMRPENVTLPELWPPEKVRSTGITAHRRGTNRFRINTNTESYTLWLSPKVVDFSQRVTVNGRRVEVTPSRRVLLEDARTRADRQEVFWAKIEMGRR